MRKAVYGLCVFTLCLFSIHAFADIQYTEESKITGGAAAGAMKFAGVFSKDARQATQGSSITISLKGNKMRHESSLGTAEIYDLDARRIVNIDLKHKTYSTMTFDEMRAQVEEAKRKAAEQQAKSHKSKSDSQVTITPKISVTPGSGAKDILSYKAKETRVRVDMEIQGQDEKQQKQTANTWVNADDYLAAVKGYDEVKRFYIKLAKELDWVPGAVFGAGNTQINQPMIEYRKSAASLNGMPLLSYVSVGMGPNPGTTGQAAAEATPEKKSGNVVTKGLGGMFGKKHHEDEADAGSGKTGSLMDMQTTVTSISNKPVDASLFQIPAGFTEQKPRKSAN